jgi:hypothetical protein
VVRVVRVNLRLAVALGALVIASPAHAAPVSAHAMVHSCCTASAMKERTFSETKDLGAEYIRVDIEMNAIFEAQDGSKSDTPDWSGLDEITALSKKYNLPVLAILLAPPRFTSACPEKPDPSRCAAADTAEFGTLAGQIAKHAAATIDHWEILNEPDGEWAFEGTPEQYAGMLSAAYDGIKAQVPSAQVLLGGLMRPHEPGWLERVFATPGADALHKLDIANIHLRGPVDNVVHRYGEFRSWIEARGFRGPLWVTEHGYPADPAFQTDRAYTGGDTAQAAYLVQTLVGLGEAGAPQVFVTLRDNLEGEYASEGLIHIEGTPGHTAIRRESFGAVRRLVMNWDQLLAWRREQRENERLVQMYMAISSVEAGEARIARVKFQQARALVHDAQDAFANPPRPARVKKRLLQRLARVRALVAGRRTALLWHSAYSRWQRGRAAERSAAVEALKAQIAGTPQG